MTVRTRFAPSPTGYLHIGGVRTALFSWLYARNMGGQFLLRIEDTDRERSTEASVNAILEGMDWLKLDYDEGPFYQTQRFDRYREVIQQLLEEGHAYYCDCSKQRLEQLREQQMADKEKPRYDGCCRDKQLAHSENTVVRFRNPDDGEVVIDDQVKGRVTISNRELDDLIIARADDTPTYNLTVVVDDWDMNISHVIRGDDHLNNTPRQINILKALNAELPVYAHVPMILGADGKRLSKRHGAVSVLQYREDGYLPDALINYLVRLGWSHGDQEVFTRDEMIQLFDPENINKSPSTFNPEKLKWLNQQYIMDLSADDLALELANRLRGEGINVEDGPNPEVVAELIRERCATLNNLVSESRYFYRDFDDYDAKAAKKHLKAAAADVLRHLLDALGALDEWAQTKFTQSFRRRQKLVGEYGQGRYAFTGCGHRGWLITVHRYYLELLGKDKTLARIQNAIEFARNREAA